MRALLLFALLGCAASASAVETTHASANGAGDCPPPQTATTAAPEAAQAIDPTQTTATKPARAGGESEEVTATGSRQRPVRWHSLLPGMVR